MANDQPAVKQTGGSKSAFAVIATIVILCIIGFLVWLLGWSDIVNGNNSINNTGTTSSQQTKASEQTTKSKIKDNWATFFNGQTPAATRVSLLQNGQQFAPAVNELSKTKAAQATSATVTNVTLDGTTATVTYTIDLNKQPVLQNQTGQAVLVNGTWKVSSAAFCSLLSLQGTTPPNCPKTGGSGSHPMTSSQQSPSGTNAQSESQTQQSKPNN